MIDLDALEAKSRAADPWDASTMRDFYTAFDPPTALALIARIRELESALRPFADYITDHPRGPTFGYDTWLNAMRHSVSWTDFDRAASALREAARISK